MRVDGRKLQDAATDHGPHAAVYAGARHGFVIKVHIIHGRGAATDHLRHRLHAAIKHKFIRYMLFFRWPDVVIEPLH